MKRVTKLYPLKCQGLALKKNNYHKYFFWVNIWSVSSFFNALLSTYPDTEFKKTSKKLIIIMLILTRSSICLAMVNIFKRLTLINKFVLSNNQIITIMAKKYQHFAITLMMSLVTITQSIAAQEESPTKTSGGKETETINLIVSGNFYADNRKLSAVTLIVKDGSNVVREVQSDEYGKFEVEMELDKILTLHFEKDDFVEKIVKIDTRNVPSEIRKYDFYYKGWKVDMIPIDLGVDASILKNPVAVVVFDPTEDGFSTDKKYERTVSSGLKKLNADVAQAYEDKFMKNENAFEDYQLAMRDGNLFLKEEDYENAIAQYEAAKYIMPNESYPDKQIAKAKELMEANKSVDERYNSYIALADESFSKKDWEESKLNYTNAKDVKPKMEYPITQLALIDKNIAAEKEYLEKMALEQRQMAYNAAVKSADSLLALTSYSDSKSKYNEALAIDSKAAYPQTKIKEIDNILANQSKTEQAYMDLMANAQSFMSSKKYNEAKNSYTQALGLKPNEELPKSKLNEIDGLLAGLAALEAKNAELAKRREEALQAEYDKLILSADALMVDNELEKARAEYEKALVVKSKEEYPIAQIKTINDKLLALEGIDKQYSSFMSNGAKYKGSADYDRAIREYEGALGLKPNEQAPKDAIADINSILAGMEADAAAKQKAIDDKYNGLVSKGDQLFASEDYSSSESAYKEALTVKSSEEYPKEQLSKIKDKLAAIAAANAATAQQAKELAEKEARYNAIVGKADQMFKSGNYTSARIEYNSALQIFSDKAYPINQIAEIDSKLAAIEADALAKQKALEAAALAEQKVIDDKYNGLVSKGDELFASEDYSGSESAYREALTVKSKEEYPKQQLSKIKDKLAAIAAANAASAQQAKELAEKEARYNAIVGKADQMFNDDNFAGAKAGYNEALTVFPDKSYPANQIAEIDSKLAAFAAAAAAKAKSEAEAAAKENEYNAAVQKGDAALEGKDYPKAKLAYQEALGVFSDRPYPTRQLEKIADLELEAKKAEEEKARLAQMAIENKVEFDKEVAAGDALFNKGDWEKAKYKYQSALKLIPGEMMATQKVRDTEAKIEEARKLAEFHAQTDTEFNRQLAVDYPNGLKETNTKGGKTETRIVIVANNRGDEYKKEEYSYGAIFYFKNGKKIDASTYERETKGK